MSILHYLGLPKIKEEFVKIEEAKILKKLELISNIWDPTGYNIDINAIAKNNAENATEYENLKQVKNKPRKNFLKLLVATFILTLLVVISNLDGSPWYDYIFFVLFCTGIPVIIFGFGTSSFTRDLIKFQIASKYGWIFNPKDSANLWHKYREIYAEVFNKGSERQTLTDMFWGKFVHNKKEYDFVSGDFEYTEVSYNMERKKRRSTFTKHFFVIHLNKKIKSRFFLEPEGTVSRLKNILVGSGKEINTESERFNKTFKFAYSGTKDENALEIVKVLSPRVQEELLRLNNDKKGEDGVSVLFSDEAAVFVFNGGMMDTLKTNFILKSLDINKEDIENIDNKLSSVINIAGEIVKYLD